jgi:hypothetical protein
MRAFRVDTKPTNHTHAICAGGEPKNRSSMGGNGGGDINRAAVTKHGGNCGGATYYNKMIRVGEDKTTNKNKNDGGRNIATATPFLYVLC